MKMLADLFLTFFRIGLFTFGGGYAMISMIGNICVDRKEWITNDEMADITVIAESTPGPVAINCATYVGFKKKGFAGAAAATLGVILPSFLIILLVTSLLKAAWKNPCVQAVLRGLKP
ncbi:MAG: chromate transporter, partial [Clostridia bacterium]|nr:chromate transporter [Clostridia bacterium]